jgi:RNA polymerase sigma-70 factor (ECF subfamily)
VTPVQHQQTFQTWLDQHRALMFKVLRAYAFTPMDRDDLFQEIIIQVWRSVPVFGGKSSVSTWIYRIALNTAIKWSRKERRRRNDEALDNVRHIVTESDVQVDERLTWLYDEIAGLNEIDRSVALLMLDDFSYKEIAAVLGITESNVGVKINRIKKHLIEKSKKYDNHGI